MTKEQMVKYLRMNVSIQDPATTQDSVYLNMTDEDILLYMNVVLTRDFPNVRSLDTLPNEYVFPVILLSKKELYYALAVKEAPLYDLGADSSYLKRSQRFDHYMELIAQTEKEYLSYLENGWAGGNTLQSFDVLLSDRYNTKRNYEKGIHPVLTLYIDGIKENSVEISWSAKTSHFDKYEVYISNSPIIDLYNILNPIRTSAKKVAEIRDVWQTACRIEGLTADTDYYVAVSITDKTTLTTYDEQSFKTLTPVVVQVGG